MHDNGTILYCEFQLCIRQMPALSHKAHSFVNFHCKLHFRFINAHFSLRESVCVCACVNHLHTPQTSELEYIVKWIPIQIYLIQFYNSMM